MGGTDVADGERDALDALWDEGPWKRAGGGRRWELIFFRVLSALLEVMLGSHDLFQGSKNHLLKHSSSRSRVEEFNKGLMGCHSMRVNPIRLDTLLARHL